MLRISPIIKVYLFILLLFTSSLWAQKNKLIDSLLYKAEHAISDKDKAYYYSELSWQYASRQKEKSLEFADKAIGYARKINDINMLADVYNSKGLAYDYSGDLMNSLLWYQKSLTIRLSQKKSDKIANVLNNIGASYYYNSLNMKLHLLITLGHLSTEKRIMIVLEWHRVLIILA